MLSPGMIAPMVLYLAYLAAKGRFARGAPEFDNVPDAPSPDLRGS